MSSRFLLRQFIHVLTPDRDLYFPYGRWAFLRRMIQWHRETFKRERYQMADPPAGRAGIRYPFTIILQNYKRPWNIEPMVRMLLRFTNVERIVVSNNNPDTAFRLPLSDSRVQVIHQTRQYPASMFAVLALHEAEKGVSHFLCIDDDLLLFPPQIEVLMRALVNDPSIPHGVVGQQLAPACPVGRVSGDVLEHHITGDRRVDILNRAYAFTDAHIRRYMQLMDRLGYVSEEEKAQLPFGSDIVLSKSGDGKPCIHAVDRLLSCPTNAKTGIARFKDEGFNQFRHDLIQKLR